MSRKPCVHFLRLEAPSSKDINPILRRLERSYKIKVLKNEDGVCELEIRISPEALKRIEKTLPRHIDAGHFVIRMKKSESELARC